MAELTAKQKRFIAEYLIDLNATQAAIRAGYSAKTAKSIGQRLLTYVDIQAELQKAMAKREKRTEITQDRVLKELAKLGFADIKDFLAFRTEKTVTEHDKETGEPVIDYAHVVELKDSDQVDGSLISEVQLKNGELKFKLHDKVKALEMCGRHLGMFKDKSEIELTVKKLEDFMK
jgi:phage terminase small subunit